MFCQNCGKELPEDAKVCPSCGHSAYETKKIKTDDVFALISLICFGIALLFSLIAIFVSWYSNALTGFWLFIFAFVLNSVGFGFIIPTLVIKRKNEK